jgi:hypothetical protein
MNAPPKISPVTFQSLTVVPHLAEREGKANKKGILYLLRLYGRGLPFCLVSVLIAYQAAILSVHPLNCRSTCPVKNGKGKGKGKGKGREREREGG